MSQSGYTPILIYASGTATNVPLAANMTSSASGAELALNYADGKLYYKNSSGAVTLLASATTVTNSFSAGTTGFTPNTATTGAVTLAGTLNVANGGTGQTTLATGALGYGQGTSAHASLAIGTAGQVLTVNSGATAPQWSTLSGVAVTTFSAGTTGFTPSSATAGAVTLAGTLATTNGGTGLTSFTANGVVYASSTSALTTGSALTFDGTNLGIGTSSPSATLDVVGTARILTNTGATNTGDQNAVVVGATTTGAYASSYGAGLQFQVTNSSGGYSGGRIVSRLAADNNTANLVFQARNYGFSDSMTLNASGQLMLATTTAQASFTIGTGGTTNTNAIIVGPTSGTATVGDKIVIGFQLRNDVGGGTGNQYAAAIAGIQDKASSNGGGLGFYTQASAGDGTPERGRFTSNGTFKIGVANSSVGTSNLLIVGSGNTQNAVSVINTADVATPALIISNWTGSTTSNGARLQFDNSGRGTFIIGTSSGANNFDICQTHFNEFWQICWEARNFQFSGDMAYSGTL